MYLWGVRPFHAGYLIPFQEGREHHDYLVLGLNKPENIDSDINSGNINPFRVLLTGYLEY